MENSYIESARYSRVITTLLGVTVLLFLPIAGSAEWHLEASVGKAETDYSHSSGTLVSKDDKDTSWSFGGHYIMDAWTFSAAYHDFGDASADFATTVPAGAPIQTVSDDGPVLSSGISFGVGYEFYTRDKFAAKVEAGFYRFDADIDAVQVIQGVGTTAISISDTGTD